MQIGVAPAGQPALEPPRGAPDHGQRIAGYYFWLFPSTLVNVYPWGLSLNLVQPLAPERTRVCFRTWVWDAALIYIAMSLGHIYMGTIGVEGAYGNMRTGYTDETWAKEHHSIWYDEVRTGRGSAPGGAVPVGSPHMREKS